MSELIEAVFTPYDPFNPNNVQLPELPQYQRLPRDAVEGVAIGLGTALASFPLGASSAGFSYLIDPTTGAPQLKAVSFGGVLVDRAVTNGRGVVNVGISYQQSTFNTLQGIDLKNVGFPTFSQLGEYVQPATSSSVLPNGADVGDAEWAQLDLKSQIFVFSGSIGVSDHLDIGWAVPVASITVNARSVRDYDAARDYDAIPSIRPLYPNRAGTLVQAEGRAEASGVGDIVLRGKYGLGPAARQVGLVIGELRLPTGDEDNLLGAGKTSFKVLGGATKRFGSAAINVNGGYTVGGLTDEVNFAAGTEVALLPRKQLTVSAEVLTQTLRDTVTTTGRLVSFDQTDPGPVGPLTRRVTVSYGFWNRESTTLARAAAGARYNVAGNLLVTGSAVFRLNDNGYQSKVTGLVGVEYTFVRK